MRTFLSINSVAEATASDRFNSATDALNIHSDLTVAANLGIRSDLGVNGTLSVLLESLILLISVLLLRGCGPPR